MIQADRVIDLIYTKYLIAEISYDNITRIEHYPFPKDAVREAVFNALIHQDFSAGIPVQISVYRDRLYISNDCIFPDDWTAETLMQKHRSLPLNPDIAHTFYRAGFIESWGRGIEKICTLCKNHNIPNPEYTVHGADIMMMFKAAESGLKSSEKNENVLNNVLNQDQNVLNNVLNTTVEIPDTTVENEKTTVENEKITVENEKTTVKILRMLQNNPFLTNSELAQMCKITEDGIFYHIKRMKTAGLIRRARRFHLTNSKKFL